MSWMEQPMAVAEAGVVEITETEIAPRTGLSQGESADDWLCYSCFNRVASEKERFAYDGKSEFLFKNPEGVRFNIVTFSQTLGCRQAGAPTTEHTWFPGHPWAYCVCDRCRIWRGIMPARASSPG